MDRPGSFKKKLVENVDKLGLFKKKLMLVENVDKFGLFKKKTTTKTKNKNKNKQTNKKTLVENVDKLGSFQKKKCISSKIIEKEHIYCKQLGGFVLYNSCTWKCPNLHVHTVARDCGNLIKLYSIDLSLSRQALVKIHITSFM